MRPILFVLIIIALGSCTKKQESSAIDTTKSTTGAGKPDDTIAPSVFNRAERVSEEIDRDNRDAEVDIGYRWNVKTLKDKDADWLWDVGMPLQHRGTINDLIHWPRPDAVNSSTAPRYQSAGTFDYRDESNVWCVEGRIKRYVHEPDGDIHLILTDGQNDLVVEVPDVDSMDTRGERKWLREQISAVHLWLQYWLKNPSRTRQPVDNGNVLVIGIPFFDERGTHASGHTPNGNGIEIHPLLGISYPDEN